MFTAVCRPVVFGHDRGGDGAGHGAGGAQAGARARRGRAVVARLAARAAQAPPPQPRVPVHRQILFPMFQIFFATRTHTARSNLYIYIHLKYLLKFAENMKYMSGFAAELRGARLWMKVAMVPTVSLVGISSYTCSMSKMMYGDQHRMNTAAII